MTHHQEGKSARTLKDLDAAIIGVVTCFSKTDQWLADSNGPRQFEFEIFSGQLWMPFGCRARLTPAQDSWVEPAR
jgi:hypothetical protein